MDIFTLAHGITFALGSVDQFACQAARHGLFTAVTRGIHQPAHRQSHTARWAYFNRNLVSCTAHTAGLNFYQRRDIVERFVKNLDGITIHLGFYFFQRSIDNSFGYRFLTTDHYVVHKFRQGYVAVLWIRQNLTFGDNSSSWHATSPLQE